MMGGDAEASAEVVADDGFALSGFPEFVRSGNGFCWGASRGLDGVEDKDDAVLARETRGKAIGELDSGEIVEIGIGIGTTAERRAYDVRGDAAVCDAVAAKAEHSPTILSRGDSPDRRQASVG
jgi:hypothetical protein